MKPAVTEFLAKHDRQLQAEAATAHQGLNTGKTCLAPQNQRCLDTEQRVHQTLLCFGVKGTSRSRTR